MIAMIAMLARCGWLAFGGVVAPGDDDAAIRAGLEQVRALAEAEKWGDAKARYSYHIAIHR